MEPLAQRIWVSLRRFLRRMLHQGSVADTTEKPVDDQHRSPANAPWGTSGVNVFLSRATGEFGHFDAGLGAMLAALPSTSLKTPSDIQGYESGYATLDKLWDFVKNADAIVHLVGKEVGHFPPNSMFEEFLQRQPELRSWLSENKLPYQNWSYTQWEVFLGKFRQHQTGGRHPRLFICGHDARELKNPLEQQHSTVAYSGPVAEHLKTLRTLNIHENIVFRTESDLLHGLMSTAFGALVHRGSQETVISLRALEPAILGSAPAKALVSWPQLTSSDSKGRWLERPEFDQILQQIKANDSSVNLLLGPPGSGKSALLARITEQFREERIATVPIKADYVSEDVATASDLAQELGLPEGTDLVTSVRRLATDTPVVVVLDQLDALARLTVHKTKRLRLLIEVIGSLSGLEGVHVVASCRTYEQRHDPLLRLIEANTIELGLPQWEEVAEALASYDLNPNGWNENLRRTLRNPQAFSTFIDLLGQTGDLAVMSSYQRMLDRLWEVRILSDESGRLSRLVLKIAEILSKREALWLPLAFFDQDRTEIERLVAADVLRIEGGKVGFRHQTLFEHARARTAAHDFSHLVDTARSKQELLRARPQIWHGLNYLRNVDLSGYHQALEALWTDDGLRKHLRMLLVDFMGMQKQPTEIEAGFFLKALQDQEWQARVLNAMSGSSGWFDRIRDEYLPLLMCQRDPGQQGPVRQLLIAAFGFDQGAALNLIRENWIPCADRTWLAWNTINQVPNWDPAVVDDVITLVSKVEVADIWIDDVCATISAHLPEEAPRLLRAWLDRQFQIGQDKGLQRTDGQKADAKSSGRRHSGNDDLFGRAKLYTVGEIARAAPGQFIQSIWPWFLEASIARTYDPTSGRRVFRFFPSLDLDFGDEADRPGDHDLIHGVDIALRECAKRDPKGFLDFLDEHSGTDSLLVQRLLSRALAKIADSEPQAVLEFLIGDPRRLALGPEYGPDTETWELFDALVPHLDCNQREKLEETVTKWEPYEELPDDDPETRALHRHWGRRYRLLLMQRIPENLRSQSFSDLVSQEELEFPEVKPDKRMSTVGSEVGSPISAEQMTTMSDDALISALLELPDWTGWSHPDDFMAGGSIQISRALGQFAKSHPDRAMTIVRALPAAQFSRPAGTVLRELSGILSAKKIFSFAEELLALGFEGDGFQSDVASAIEQSVSPEFPLPEMLCRAMESWLGPVSTIGVEFDSGDADRDESLLWGHGGLHAIPGTGNRPILAALGKAYRAVQPPQWSRWLDLFENHLEREEDPEVWASMVWELQFLGYADRARATRFIDRLFSKYPEILPTKDATRLLYSALRWSDEEHFLHWLKLLMRQEHPRATQSAGELLLLRNFWFPNDARTSDLVATTIAAAPELTNHPESLHIGLGYTASEGWTVTQFRVRATEIWVSLLERESDKLNLALSGIFRCRNESDFPADRQTRSTLESILRHPDILKQQAAEFLIEHLTNLLSQHWEPDLVGSVAIALADQVGDTMADIRTAWPISAAMLTDIVQFLQESEFASVRLQGVELMEKLLEYSLPAADDLIDDLDMRIPVAPRARIPRRRRRQRVKKNEPG